MSDDMGFRMKEKIYDLDYLMNEELTDEDLHYLFDTKSLNYSLLIAMFRFIDVKDSNKEIIKMCSKDNNWIESNKYRWTLEQREKFTQNLSSVYKNVYQYRENKSRQLAEWWIIHYGFYVNNTNKKKK